MNTKEYIESGILEAYVLGALPKEEYQQVAANIALYPELQKEVLDIEDAMFHYCEAYAVTPPAHLQAKIEMALPGLHAHTGSGSNDSHRVTRTVPIEPEYRKPVFVWRNAAAVAVLIGSLAVNYYFWSNGNHEHQEKTALMEQMTQLQTKQQELASRLGDYQSSKAMMADTAIQTIVMHTVVAGHPMAATLYWSKAKGDAFVAMDALPLPPEGMQYQLWVIQKGKPVSMGMLASNMANTPVMEKIAMQVTSGDAFAISLEKKGGNPTPTTVYVVGKA